MLGFGNVIQAQMRTDCKDKVKRLLQEVSSINRKAQNNEVFRMEYTYTVGLRKPKKETYQTTVSMIGNDAFFEMKSEDIEIYHDYDNALIIYPKQKIITLSEMDAAYMKQIQPSYIGNLQDSALSRMNVKSCGHPSREGIEKIILEPAGDWKKAYSFHSCSFLLANDKIKQLRVEFLDHLDVEFVQYDYTLLDTSAKRETPKRNLMRMVMDKNEKLLPPYKGFRFEDVRNRH